MYLKGEWGGHKEGNTPTECQYWKDAGRQMSVPWLAEQLVAAEFQAESTQLVEQALMVETVRSSFCVLDPR